MSNSWYLGKLAGIDVKVHWTFLMLPAWVVFTTVLGSGSAAMAAPYLLLILSVFGCVVLHELGHALAARKYGIETHDIVLYPIGGIASLLRIPKNPMQELVIAVAGPAVNVVIAAVLFLWLAVMPISGFAGWLVYNLAWLNVGLVLFNMLPAFPMDGGRVLRSTLAMFMSHYQATQIATSVARVTAIGLGFVALFSGQLMLMVIGVFVYLAATVEARQSEIENTAGQDNGRRFTSPFVNTPQPDHALPKIYADWKVESALRWISRRATQRFSVVKNGGTIGVASVSDLQYAVANGHGNWPVEKVVKL